MRSVRRLGLYEAVNIDLKKQPADCSACIDVPPVFLQLKQPQFKLFVDHSSLSCAFFTLCVFFKEIV